MGGVDLAGGGITDGVATMTTIERYLPWSNDKRSLNFLR